jgi:multidrug resistance efflux pump
MNTMSGTIKNLLTGIVVLIAAGALAFKYWDYLINPWTRDGQVRANVIQVAPRVSGPIVKLPIVDNQFVRAGDLLFEIDPRTYKANLDQAHADYDKTLDDLSALEKQVDAAKASVKQYQSAIAESQSTVKSALAQLTDAEAKFKRYRKLAAEGTVSQQRFEDIKAQYQIALANKERADAALLEANAALLQTEANLAQAQANLGAPGEENARLRAAKAARDEAQLNLDFTRVKASVDGYVTNLELRLGSQAVANQPALALVDVNSFWVHGFFQETALKDMRKGNRAIITLMTYPDTPLEGYVDSLGWGIAQQDGSTGFELLPNVSPTFEWIRLAQRVPVRVHLTDVPDGIQLRVGTTASVLVMTGENQDGTAPPAPKALQ